MHAWVTSPEQMHSLANRCSITLINPNTKPQLHRRRNPVDQDSSRICRLLPVHVYITVRLMIFWDPVRRRIDYETLGQLYAAGLLLL